MSGSDTTHCDPEHDPGGLGRALTFLGHMLTTATVSADGTLNLRFDDGRCLSASADSDLESWNIRGPGNLLVIGGPTYRVTLFRATE